MAQPVRNAIRHEARATQFGQQQRQHDAPDRVVEQPGSEAVPRPRLAGAPGLRPLELGHAQLEDPARIFLWLVGAEEHALLAAPVEDREVGLRHESLGGGYPPAPRVRESVNDPVDDRQREQRQRQPDQDLLRDLDRIDGHHDDDRGRDERAEQHAQRDGDDRGPAERRDRLGESRVMDGPHSARFVRAGGDRDARRGGIDARRLRRRCLRRARRSHCPRDWAPARSALESDCARSPL